MEHPDRGPVTALPYTERRALLLDVLAAGGPPIQAVPATDDRTVALHWYETLRDQGIEGIVAKLDRAPYPAGRRIRRVKIRHADTVNAQVVGFTGLRRRPRNLALVLDGESRPRLSAALVEEMSQHAAEVISGVRSVCRRGR
ncbi:hypothetical protein A6A29_38050 [Streptomyces sp. TSRI0281]|nr:hypothetical protein A6A29_38050 [Streptomyces sp. TSRI0281]